MQAASQLTAHAAQVRNPFHKAMLKFRFRGYRHNDASQCIDRHQETGNHHLLISIFQQIFRQITEERIHDIGLVMQTNDNRSRFSFLGCMQNTRSNVQVEARHCFQKDIGRCSNLSRPFQASLSPHLQPDRIIVIINHIQCHQIVRPLFITYHQRQLHQFIQCVRIGYRNQDTFLLLFFFFIQLCIIHRNSFGRMFRNKRADHTRHQNQQNGTIQHIFVQQALSTGQNNVVTHQYRRQGSRSLCITQSEHQFPFYRLHAIYFLCQPRSNPFA